MAFFLNTEDADNLLGTNDDDEFSYPPLIGEGGGDDSFSGRRGNDYALGGTGNDTLRGGDGDDTLYGEDGDDFLFGDDGADALYGGAGGGILNAGSGNDRIFVPANFEEALGGAGRDLLDFGQETSRGIRIELSSGNFEGASFSGIEDLGGTQKDDELIGDGGRNRLFGHDGDDTLAGGGGDDVLEGGSNNFAASNDDDLSGGDGNDRLNGDTGSDVLSGGLGNDYLDTGGRFESGNDDTALGGAGDDTLVTDAGDDTLNGGKGNDTAQLNVFNFNVVVDMLTGGPVNIGSGILSLVGIENVTANSTRGDSLSGNNKANRFDAAQGDDQLNGRGGNDILLGRTGNDTLTGGTGADTMTGNEDADTFVYLGPNDSTAAASDRITDFLSATDKLNFVNFVDGSGNGVDFTFIGGNAFSGADELRFEAGVVSGDFNGDGQADVVIRLAGVTSLQASDFQL